MFVPPPPFCNIEISSHFLSSERWGAYPLSPYPETQNSFQFVYASGNTEGEEGEGSDQLLRTETFLYRGGVEIPLPSSALERKKKKNPSSSFFPALLSPPSLPPSPVRRRPWEGGGGEWQMDEEEEEEEVDPPPSKLLFL